MTLPNSPQFPYGIGQPSVPETIHTYLPEHPAYQTPQESLESIMVDPLILKALSGDAGIDQKTIAEVGLEWTKILLQKNADYGSTIFRVPKLAPDTTSDICIRVRMNDKVDRLMHLLALGEKNRQIKAESIADTMVDLGAYCLLWIVNQRLNSKK